MRSTPVVDREALKGTSRAARNQELLSLARLVTAPSLCVHVPRHIARWHVGKQKVHRRASQISYPGTCVLLAKSLRYLLLKLLICLRSPYCPGSVQFYLPRLGASIGQVQLQWRLPAVVQSSKCETGAHEQTLRSRLTPRGTHPCYQPTVEPSTLSRGASRTSALSFPVPHVREMYCLASQIPSCTPFFHTCATKA